MNRKLRRIVVLSSIVGASFVAGQASADAANLQSALQHLQAARGDLEAGGKKNDGAQQALFKVEQAIDDVRKGIEQEKRREQKAAKEAAEQQERAAKQEQRDQEKAAKQAQEAQDKAAQQQQKALDKAAAQEKKAQKKALEQAPQ